MKIETLMESYKPLIAVPIIITIIALAILATNGLNESVDLKGGTITTLQLQKSISQDELKSMIENGLNTSDVTVNSFSNNQATVTIGTEADANTFTNLMNGTATILSYRSVGAVLSSAALTQIIYTLIFAFLFMSVTVFIVFRNFVPSMAVILAALSDIIIAAGGMSLFGIPLSLASVGALLLLIGYSVDTDILLTARVLKRREGTITERAINAMKTGFTMAAAAIGSMVALYVIVLFFIPSAATLQNIAEVLMIGLAADVIATWLMNLGILRWYMESGRR
ncbi:MULTISPECIES: protein translocase subunit SecF [Methanobacterium]|jgi:preprotein translocase subunit SecF|uniref:Protein-export membrane protein SecF n=1 Tax=Methanobacterium veterum TaxID=408577 RepID=A0A9E5DN54_9EURY|nr:MULTISPECIES: protein translocase subunit SecF [Methanobacterium]MCZ3367450.1 protein translocase subunit SecF [Methanobacterium veterum]MCZ3373402.1 protein translocase subunit SecF [Methanobacterium veterum]